MCLPCLPYVKNAAVKAGAKVITFFLSASFILFYFKKVFELLNKPCVTFLLPCCKERCR